MILAPSEDSKVHLFTAHMQSPISSGVEDSSAISGSASSSSAMSASAPTLSDSVGLISGGRGAEAVRRDQVKELAAFVRKACSGDEWPVLLVGCLNVNARRGLCDGADSAEYVDMVRAFRREGFEMSDALRDSSSGGHPITADDVTESGEPVEPALVQNDDDSTWCRSVDYIVELRRKVFSRPSSVFSRQPDPSEASTSSGSSPPPDCRSQSPVPEDFARTSTPDLPAQYVDAGTKEKPVAAAIHTDDEEADVEDESEEDEDDDEDAADEIGNGKVSSGCGFCSALARFFRIGNSRGDVRVLAPLALASTAAASAASTGSTSPEATVAKPAPRNRLSRHITAAPQVEVTFELIPGSVAVVPMEAPPGKPFNYLSDHHAVQASFRLEVK